MIAHIVLFCLKPGLGEDARQGLADALARAAQDIPSIRHARLGFRVLIGRPYEKLMTDDYPFAAILEFEDTAGLRAYLDHPAHEQLAARFFTCVERALLYDFELHDTDEGIRAIRKLI